MSKILAAVDGSECALQAACVAAEIARRSGVELLAATVYDPSPLYVIGALHPGAIVSDQTVQRQSAEWHDYIEQRVKSVLSDKNLPVRFLHETGSPVEKIVQAAEQEQVDMIVAGSRGKGGFQRLLLGSVAEGILHHAHCPVLIVR